MAHYAQRQFCQRVKSMFTDSFHQKRVLDIGSADINGSNQYLFTECAILGVDVAIARNVNLVMPVHELAFQTGTFETVISTESMEHDPYLSATMMAAYWMLAHGGLFLFTCATEGRAEHGTKRTAAGESMGTIAELEDFADFYQNVTPDMIQGIWKPIGEMFDRHEFTSNHTGVDHDLYFWGVKRA